MVNAGIRTLNRPDLSWYQRQRHNKFAKQQEAKKYLYGLQDFPNNSGLDAFLFENPGLSDATMVANFKRWAFGFENSGSLKAVTFDQLCDFSAAGERTYVAPSGSLQTAAANEPRIDYDPATGTPIGLLIEKSRTNYLPQSADLSDAVWSPIGVTVSPASATKGSGDAWLLTEDTSDGSHYIDDNDVSGIAPDQTITAQVKIKANGRTSAQLTVYGDTTSNRILARFDLSAVSVDAALAYGTGTVDGATIADLGDGWYLCTVTGQPSTGTASGLSRFRIYVISGGSVAHPGDGTSGIYVMDPQVEAGSVASSYIETNGSAITRVDEIVSLKQVGTWLQQGVGTLILRARYYEKRPATSVDGVRFRDSVDGSLIAIRNVAGTDSQAFPIRRDLNGFTFGTGIDEATSGTTLLNMATAAVAYDQTSAQGAWNGATTPEDTSVEETRGIDTVELFTSSEGFGWVEWFAYIPRKLTEAELQSITG